MWQQHHTCRIKNDSNLRVSQNLKSLYDNIIFVATINRRYQVKHDPNKIQSHPLAQIRVGKGISLIRHLIKIGSLATVRAADSPLTICFIECIDALIHLPFNVFTVILHESTANTTAGLVKVTFYYHDALVLFLYKCK